MLRAGGDGGAGEDPERRTGRRAGRGERAERRLVEQHYDSAQGYISQELGVSEGQIAALQDKFLA